MDNERAKRISSLRASLGSFSNFSQNDDLDEIDDPISAYFKKRCNNSSKLSFSKKTDSDSDSSLGLIDVDNISLFDFEEEIDVENIRFSDKIEQLNNDPLSNYMNKKKSKKSIPVVPAPETELEKQRTLAQKALQRLSDKSNEKQSDVSIITPEKNGSKALNDISSKLMNIKLTEGKGVEKNWLEPNFSPNTPRYFNDELSSFGGNSINLPGNTDQQDFSKEESNNKRESLYAKKVNSLLNEIPEITASDSDFKSQTEEEQINRLEEDEKKFKLEHSGVLHNSRISQFSEGDASSWRPDSSNPEVEAGGKNLSIGQFFNMRSNRVSSLVGSAAEDNSIPDLETELKGRSPSSAETKRSPRSERSFSMSDTPVPGKSKFRRCVSTYDLKGTSEAPKTLRYSSDSCSSNSTAMIQDILAEMESGLSGTQIYEKLMRSYGRREKEEKERKKPEQKKKVLENPETPKSSKVPKEKDAAKLNRSAKKDLSSKDSHKESKKSNGEASRLFEKDEFKENEPIKERILNESVAVSTKEKGTIPKTGKGFYASTPKAQTLKSQNDKFKTDCGKILMNCDGWEVPRINLIQPTIDLSSSEMSEDNDKTITVSSTEICSDLNRKNSTTIMVNDTLTIEDTIVAGDLTVLSQRIDEMKQDSVCIVRQTEPEEPVLLTVIQKLADLPKGTVDCSALTPLLRDQFPELLSSFPTPAKDSTISSIATTSKKVQDTFITLPGSWVQLPEALGIRERLYACADLPKTILVPMFNISQNWLLISIQSVELIHSVGKKLQGVKKNDDWHVLDFVVISLKETIIPPNSRQSLKVSFKSKVFTQLEFILTFAMKELMNGEVQTRSLRIVVKNVHPENYINVIPKDPINFGVIADQCFDFRTVQVSFDGICQLPLTVYIDENETRSGQFFLRPNNAHQLEYSNNIFHHIFYEGEKQVLEFRVFFQPNVLLKEDSKIQDFKGELVLKLGGKTETDGVLQKIPLKGSVGFAKFLCNPSCTPLVFRASEKGQSVTRSFPLKNVGSLPIALSVWVLNKEVKNEEEDAVFVTPKSFYLSRNEEAAINVTFKAPSTQNCIRRLMMLQIKPNGRAIYDVELIGITSSEGKIVSRASGASASTKSTAHSESLPVKLLTTTYSLSWTAIPLERESRQTFQIKSVSTVTTSVRISFKRNTEAFKLVNENGEKVNKMRKVLKPDCPCTLTVVFRPDVVGTHQAHLTFEANHSTIKKMILLNGIGGTPNLFMGNVKPDLNGCKILRLQYSLASNQFESVIPVKNEGRIPGFLLIKSGMKDFSLSHELTITPSSIVIAPDSMVSIKISQKLTNEDLQQLLSDREISKVATICVLIGDEPSRMRLKKLVENGTVQNSERLKIFTTDFHKEQPLHIKSFKDPVSFETEFLKSLKVYEVAVVVERTAEIYEPSILEDTVDEFVSFISADENTVISTGKPKKPEEANLNTGRVLSKFNDGAYDITETFFPTDSLKSSHKRVTKWLETLDCL